MPSPGLDQVREYWDRYASELRVDGRPWGSPGFFEVIKGAGHAVVVEPDDVYWLEADGPSTWVAGALTFARGGDLSTHLTSVFSELQGYEIMTGGFVNYYAPEGHGGVMTAYPYQAGPDFYDLRVPQAVWHHGEAMITTNQWTDGTTTPVDEDFGADAYYDNESSKTLESHWNLLASGGDKLHMMSVAYRGRRDMTIWADGRIDPPHGGRTPRLEWEWSELYGSP